MTDLVADMIARRASRRDFLKTASAATLGANWLYSNEPSRSSALRLLGRMTAATWSKVTMLHMRHSTY